MLLSSRVQSEAQIHPINAAIANAKDFFPPGFPAKSACGFAADGATIKRIAIFAGQKRGPQAGRVIVEAWRLWHNMHRAKPGGVEHARSVGAAGAQVPYKHKVTCSNHVPTTTKNAGQTSLFASGLFCFLENAPMAMNEPGCCPWGRFFWHPRMENVTNDLVRM